MMNLPIGIEHNTARWKTEFSDDRPWDTSKYNIHVTRDEVSCYNACVKNRSLPCNTWYFKPNANKTQPGKCVLNTNFYYNSFEEGSTSGIMGNWSTSDTDSVTCLTFRTAHSVYGSGFGSMGNYSTCTSKQPGVIQGYAFASDLAQIWNKFTKSGVWRGDPGEGPAIYGASMVNFKMKAKSQKIITFYLTWNAPYRDFIDLWYQNIYSTIYPYPARTADYINKNLLNELKNISALNTAFLNSSLPDFLQDLYINSLGHIRSAFWVNDIEAKWRQWESYDCANIGSLHNEGERHIPYIMFFPDTTRNKLVGWAEGQLLNGMIQEELGHCGCATLAHDHSVIDTQCGRIMSDVSSMFIVYVLELYQWANDTDTLTKLWNNVKRAAQWHIDVSHRYGIPEKLVNTYDVLMQNKYDLCSFNSAFHLLAMVAAKQVALAVGDKQFAEECQKAFEKGQDAMDSMQWNVTGGYYNSYSNLSASSNPGAIMTDTFYAQVLAFSLGLGVLVKNETKLLSHMKQEIIHNDSPYGMLVQTGRYPYPGPPQDNAVWLMGNPNWATISLHLGQDVKHAVSVANKSLNRWRSELNDIWNIPAIAGGLGYGAEGQPWGNSHYGYFMSSWHILFALSGQQANIPQGILTFNPKNTTSTWSYPVLLPGILGSISQSQSHLSLTIHVGELTLTKLAVRGNDCGGPYPLILREGEQKICRI